MNENSELGAPRLPIDTLVLFLKEGESIKNAAIIYQSTQALLLDKDVQHVTPPMKSTDLEEYLNGEKNPLIYESRELYPGIMVGKIMIQYYHGYKLAYIPFHPIQYSPLEKILYSAKEITFRIETEQQAGETPSNNTKPQKSYEQEIRNMIDNKEILDNQTAH
jgi:hypothetical protein